MRICILYSYNQIDVNHIINLIAKKYNMMKIEFDGNVDKILIDNTITSMSLSDYIIKKDNLKHMITCYIDCSNDIDEIIENEQLFEDELFSFKIFNNNILSKEQIADMIYEASYGRELLSKERKKLMYKVEENELLFAKTKENAIIPSKRDEDGCYDIYACFDEDEVEIKPFTNKLIDSGIATAFDKRWRLAIRERGSNSKSGLITMSGQVDSGYRGSIFVSLYNANSVPVIISKNVDVLEKTDDYIKVPYSKAIAQFAMEEVPVLEEKEIDYEILKTIASERGVGALGSSGK